MDPIRRFAGVFHGSGVCAFLWTAGRDGFILRIHARIISFFARVLGRLLPVVGPDHEIETHTYNDISECSFRYDSAFILWRSKYFILQTGESFFANAVLSERY